MKTLFLSLLAAVSFMLVSAVNPGAGYKPGDVATDFSLKNVNGKTVSMRADKNAKGFIVTFTCNECPYAKLYEDRLIALHNKYAPQGYPVIAINPNDPTASPDDSFELMQKRAKEKAFPFPYLTDAGQKITKAYGATRTPHLYILNREEGNLVVRYIGALDDNSRDEAAVTKRYAEAALEALLAGQPVATTTTKAVGCTIKWAGS